MRIIGLNFSDEIVPVSLLHDAFQFVILNSRVARVIDNPRWSHVLTLKISCLANEFGITLFIFIFDLVGFIMFFPY